jgi:hypothetical protein
MMIDAGITTLTVQKIASEYGYRLIDAHFHNVIFENSTAKFCDLNSFARNHKPLVWPASGEFRSEIKLPISVACMGFDEIVSSAIEHQTISNSLLWNIKNPLISKMLRVTRLQNRITVLRERLALVGVFNITNALLHLSIQPLNGLIHSTGTELRSGDNRVSELDSFSTMKRISLWMLSKSVRLFLNINPEKEISRLNRLRKNFSPGYWTDYYKVDRKAPSNVSNENRFSALTRKVSLHPIDSITDVGGNDGRFLQMMIANDYIKAGVVLDGDSNSIERGRQYCQLTKSELTFAKMDFQFHRIPLGSDTWDFKSDLVTALAITHHLSLRYRMSFDDLINRICSYTSKYAAIEFMPLGLSSESHVRPLPDWYTESSFLRSLEKCLNVTDQINSVDGRTLFWGELH